MASTFNAFTLRARPAWTRRRSGIGSTSLLAAALATACSGGQTGDENTGSVIQELKGDAPRVAASGTLPNSASADGWAFAWKFYGEEATATENAFFSPYSISVASAMLVAGAAGETRTEIQSALDFSTDGEAFHQAQNAVSQALLSRNRPGSQIEATNAQTLRLVNDLWLAPAYRPASAFLDTLSAYYGASTYLAPFDTDPEASRKAINEKVATDTEQLIDEILPSGSLDRDVVCVLTNAIYFKATWEQQFGKAATQNEPFLADSGASSDVPMMHAEFGARYVVKPDYQAIALPYSANELELVAIMPTQGTFGAFIDGTSAESVTRISGELARGQVDLKFPKFGIESQVPLKARLQALGMLRAFEPGADFSPLGRGLYIRDAFHDATIELDEEGTEAAAATAIVAVPESIPPTPVPLVFDHPFVFFIRDIETNALLFVGHYVAP
jgi:serpin B